MHAPTLDPITPGFIFQGRYRVVRCIKAGAMGAVYEVFDERIRSPRALKIMLPHLAQDPDMRVRFAQEARIVGEIESDHLVRVSDAGVDQASGAPFLVMDLLRGDELGQLLKRRGPLSTEETVLYLHQAALALDKTHAAGVVHRDLKPENLFVTRRDDGTASIKILDFGVAKIVQGSDAGATRSVGTPLYMAPEQILGHRALGPQTDVYALGHLAFTLLVGKAYWREEAASKDALLPLLARVSAGPVEPASVRSARWGGPELPPAFDVWFFRATARDPEARFESASAAVGALSAALSGSKVGDTVELGTGTGDSSMGASIPGVSRRSWGKWVGGGLGTVVVVVVLWGVFWGRERGEREATATATASATASATATATASATASASASASASATASASASVPASAPVSASVSASASASAPVPAPLPAKPIEPPPAPIPTETHESLD